VCYKKWSFHVYSDGWRYFLVCISSASERKETWINVHPLHHTQMHFKCTHFFNHFQIARSWRWNRFPVYIKTMRSCSSMFDTSSQSFQRQDDQEVDAHLFMFLSSPKQTKCTLENDVIHHCKHDGLAIWKWLKKCTFEVHLCSIV
jgi:hypothetical protein